MDVEQHYKKLHKGFAIYKQGETPSQGWDGARAAEPTESQRDGASAWLLVPTASTAVSRTLSMGGTVFV